MYVIPETVKASFRGVRVGPDLKHDDTTKLQTAHIGGDDESVMLLSTTMKRLHFSRDAWLTESTVYHLVHFANELTSVHVEQSRFGRTLEPLLISRGAQLRTSRMDCGFYLLKYCNHIVDLHITVRSPEIGHVLRVELGANL